MSENISYAIDIVSLNKSFRRSTLVRQGYTTVKSSVIKALFGSCLKGDADRNLTWAVKNLTLRVPRGASIGVIGRNGSGKSTLLKLVTGIYKPNTGRISVNGRLAALIELGAGFHPDFTGRENLFLGGVMYGLSRAEVAKRFDEIVRFAELEDVIDDPVRTYSSGMFMRLGFSLSVHTDPDILLIDEVLAVGDASFVGKCKERLARLKREGKTLLLVSHDLDAVERWCDEALWLHAGEARDRGDPRRVIDHYREFIERGEERDLVERRDSPEAPKTGAEESPKKKAARWGSREIEITAAKLCSADGDSRLLFHAEDKLRIELSYVVHDSQAIREGDVVFGIAINRSDGLAVLGTNTDIEKIKLPPLGRMGVVAYEIARLGLLEGSYSLDVAVHKKEGYPYDYHQGILTFAVRWPQKQLGVVLPKHAWLFGTKENAA